MAAKMDFLYKVVKEMLFRSARWIVEFRVLHIRDIRELVLYWTVAWRSYVGRTWWSFSV